MILQQILATASLLTGSVPQQAVMLEADLVLLPEGALAHGRVLVVDGKIAAVGKDLALEGDTLLLKLEGQLSPGLVALGSTVGLSGEGRDSTRIALDGADLVHGYDPKHKAWESYLEAGITTVVLSAEEGALVGGWTAVVKPTGRILSKKEKLEVSFAESALQLGLGPSSYQGALAELEERLAEGLGGFGLLKEGRSVRLTAHDRAEALRATAFAARHGLSGLLVGCPRAGDLAQELAGARLGVALLPIGVGADPRVLRTPAELAKAGVAFGFYLGDEKLSPEALRYSASQAQRGGLSREGALASLTSAPAALCGAPVGRIAVGSDADFVLWSGDPLDLSSEVSEVWVDGRRVHGGDEE